MILNQKKWIDLERRLIQLKIEREALKKETDEASKKRLEDLEEEIKELEKEYADLEEIWKAEKASLQGAQQIKEELEQARIELETARRAGDLARMSELQYGRIPELEKQLASSSKRRKTRNNIYCATKSLKKKLQKWFLNGRIFPLSKMLEGEKEKLLHMEEALHKRVIGQDEAVQCCVQCHSPFASRTYPIPIVLLVHFYF